MAQLSGRWVAACEPIITQTQVENKLTCLPPTKTMYKHYRMQKNFAN